MVNIKIVGIGAGGNKAAITAIQTNVVAKENVLLINSTLKDIPKDYDGRVYQYSTARKGGAGKERNIAKELLQEDLKNGKLDLESFVGTETDLVVIVSSSEGGTGSGSSPLFASYIKNVLGIEVRCFGFTGFMTDIRGLRNTVEYFKEMTDEFAVEAIQNDKFLEDNDNDKIKAEQAANIEFGKKIAVLSGNMLRDSSHNIDPTDLLKISTTPNYSIIEYKEFKKIQNKKEFSEMVKQMVYSSKAVDLNTPSQKRMAVMINIQKDNTSSIDYQDVLTEKFGEAFEVYEHIQHEEDMPNFFAFISSGNKIPVKEIEDIFTVYQQRLGKVDKSKDDFYDKEFRLDDRDADYNLKQSKKTVSADDFFKTLGAKPTKSKKSTTDDDFDL